MSIPVIYVKNSSTCISDADVVKMVAALNLVLPKFNRDWKINGSIQGTANVLPKTSPTPTSGLVVYIMDYTDITGTVGYHTLVGGLPSVKVFAKTILDEGGAVLYEPTRTKPTVAQILSHEIYEALLDTKSTAWWMNPNTGVVYASEVSDPVDGNVVALRLSDGTRVALSDWILPAWIDVANTIGPYNNLDTLTAPFQLANTGYAMTAVNGHVDYIYGANVSDKKKAYLQLSMRTLLRVAASNGV
jgi:hypothetical protein